MEMERDQELKHCCKVCGKSFPCGRSLGGHMRSHLAMNSSTEVEVGAGYGLRENPKKTWQLSNSRGNGSPRHHKLCKKCGKGFPSWKSLVGHMRCHPEKSDRNLEEGEEQDKEFEEQEGSWSAGGQSDNKALIPRRKRSRRVASILASSSLVLEFEKEQEDVALSLMMLSRDIGFWSGISSIAESSDKNLVVLEDVASEGDEIGKEKKRSEFIASRNGDKRDGPKKVEFDVSDDDDIGVVKDDESKKPKAYASDTDKFKYLYEASRKGSLKKKDLNCGLAELGRKTRFDQWHSGVRQN